MTAFQQHSKHRIENLIDEDEFTFYSSGRKTNEKKWVQMELAKESMVHYIKIRNRRNCCGERFSNAEFRVGTYKVLENIYNMLLINKASFNIMDEDK